MAPRCDPDLALVYENEKKNGNANRATLAVARKMVAYLMAVDRGLRDFVRAEDRSGSGVKKPANEEKKHQDHGARRLPGPAPDRVSDGDQTPEASF